MLFRKKVEFESKNGVEMVNGTISFLGGVSLNVYCYSIDGVLIDTGAKALEHEFIPYLRKFDVDQVVITHHHEDHSGNAAFIQQELHLSIWMHPQRIEECKQKAHYPLYRKLFWGTRPPFHAQPLASHFHSHTTKWEVIYSPGHADDHVAFLNTETGQLFSGDLYVMDRLKVCLREENLPQLIQSIQRVLTYDFAEMYCSHAGYIKDGRAALVRKLEHLLELQDRILRLHKEGHSVKSIHQQLFPKKYPIAWFSSGEWDSSHIVRSFINHTVTDPE